MENVSSPLILGLFCRYLAYDLEISWNFQYLEGFNYGILTGRVAWKVQLEIFLGQKDNWTRLGQLNPTSNGSKSKGGYYFTMGI